MHDCDIIASPGVFDQLSRASFVSLVSSYVADRVKGKSLNEIRSAVNDYISTGPIAEMGEDCMTRGMARLVSEAVIDTLE